MQVTPTRTRSSIYYLFLGLAGLTVLAVFINFLLLRKLGALHEVGAVFSKETAEAIDQINEVQDLAGKIATPGNDVFLSGDSVAERQRVNEAMASFRAKARAVESSLAASGVSDEVQQQVATALASVTLMEWYAYRTIDAHARGDLVAATRNMAEMDRQHTRFTLSLQVAQSYLSRDESIMFARQEKELIVLENQEKTMRVVLLLLTGAILLFARRAGKEMVHARELDHYVSELQEREASLVEAINQRDLQTRNLEEAQAVAGLGSWTWDVVSNEISWSAELHRIFGTSLDSFDPSYEGYLSRVHPEDRERVDLTVRTALGAQRPYDIEHRLLHTDGTETIITARGNVETDKSGNVVRMFGIVLNITGRRVAEASLRRSEERFQLASRATNDVIWDWDLNTNTLWMNEGWVRQFGFATSGYTEISEWSAAIHPDDHSAVMDSIHAVLNGTESIWTGEYRIRAGKGEYRTVMDRGCVVRDAAGKPIRMIGAMMDITQRKEAEDSINRLHHKTELILKSVADGLFDVDHEGVTTFVNPAAAHMLGYEPDELVGKKMHTVAHYKHEDGTEFPWEECPERLTLQDGLGRSSTGVFWSRSGKAIPVDFTTMAILDEKGNVTGAVKTFRDISHRVVVDRMKDEFVSTVSHELRTPLTSIRGALGLLGSGRLGVLPEKAARLLEIASTNTDRLVRLINDILDIEKMESGKASIIKLSTDAATLVREATDLMRELANQAGITLEASTSATPVHADPDRIIQTLTNLISNAIKFSPPSSTIRVTTDVEDGKVIFRVVDQGRGIPPEKLQMVFERFKQVDASDSRDKGGSGLGLAICRSIVRQHGGEITVQSEMGRGSEFSFSLPLGAAQPVPAPDATDPDSEDRLIFICDDEIGSREVMNLMLTQHGFRVREFARGALLLEALKHQRPDLILLDLFMPDMNGWESLARLKTNPETARIPVIVVSVLSPGEFESPYVDLCGWLHKPLEEGELLDAVVRGLRSSDRARRILIVEDDADLARVIAGSFERYGIEVTVAPTGQEAIRLASTFVPDLLVLDLMLPEVDGFGVVDWIKEHGLWAEVPLVVYSAVETTVSQQERLRLGPTEFITKSRIGPEEFERRVLSLLDQLTQYEHVAPMTHV